MHSSVRRMQWPVAVIALLAGGAIAKTPVDTALHCDVAAAQAAKETGVPGAVLMAIARVETGRTVAGELAPWPWTVNEAGAGSWFTTVQEAVDHVNGAVAGGGSNIDIGCFQVNLRWHGKAFASLDSMFDPLENARYAARFLGDLFTEHGTWDGAIGAYHSRRADAAEAYLTKVSALLNAPLPDVDRATLSAGPQDPVTRDNRYPLMQGGAGASKGSLFSAATPSASPLLR